MRSMNLKWFSLLIVLCVVYIAHAGNYRFMKTSGRWLMPKQGENVCSTAKWLTNNDTGEMLYQFGSTEVRLSDEGTWMQFFNEDTSMTECKRDSDVTYQKFKEMMNDEYRYMVGTFDFIKPFTGSLNLTYTRMPTTSHTQNTLALIWDSLETGWAGIDWVFTKQDYKTWSRLWWDNFSTDDAPSEEEMTLNSCNATSTLNQMPTADCNDFYSAPEATFHIGSKSIKSRGLCYKWQDGSHKTFPVKFSRDPKRKLLSFVCGDPSKQNDPEKFYVGSWMNASGTYMVRGGQGGCTWIDSWTYDDDTNDLSTPNLAWIGKARIEKWWATSALGLEVNLYLGVTSLMFPKPVLIMVDNEGVHRAGLFTFQPGAPPDETFYDVIEEKDPDDADLLPFSTCDGYKDFLDGAAGTGAGQRQKVNVWYIVLLLCCGFIVKFI